MSVSLVSLVSGRLAAWSHEPGPLTALDRGTTLCVLRWTEERVALAGFGRYSQPALLVVLSLLDGDKHGYAIADDIEAVTGERPGPGTLYGAIARLEDRGLIEAGDIECRRKPYRLTNEGLIEGQREVARLGALTREMTRRVQMRTVTT